MRYFVIILSAVFALAPVAARAGDDVRAKIQTAYDAQCKAFIAKDADAFQKTFDSKYQSTDLDGKHETLTDVVNQVTASTPGITIATCTFKIRSMTVTGTTATVLATATASGTLMQNGGASSPVSQIQETTDTWNVAGAPIQMSSVETGLRATVGTEVVQQKGTLATPPGGP